MSERTHRRTGRAHPIKQVLRDRGQGQSWMARRLGMNEAYVRGMIAGVWPASRRLRDGASELLGLAEADLFHSDDASAEGAPTETSGGPDDHAGVVVRTQAYPIRQEAAISKTA